MSQHIGYKKIQNDFIVKLRIKGQNNEGRSDIKPENVPFAKYRCERAFVVDIYHSLDKTKHNDKGYGLYDPKFSYTVGKYVKVKDYNKDIETVSSTGIHYFLSEEPAFFWEFDLLNYTGEYKQWDKNGQLSWQFFYKNGKKDGEEKLWHSNSQLAYQAFYKNDTKDGEEKRWHPNGQLAFQVFYKDGKLDGEENLWHPNSQLLRQRYYKDGLLYGKQKDWDPTGQLELLKF